MLYRLLAGFEVAGSVGVGHYQKLEPVSRGVGMPEHVEAAFEPNSGLAEPLRRRRYPPPHGLL